MYVCMCNAFANLQVLSYNCIPRRSSTRKKGTEKNGKWVVHLLTLRKPLIDGKALIGPCFFTVVRCCFGRRLLTSICAFSAPFLRCDAFMYYLSELQTL